MGLTEDDRLFLGRWGLAHSPFRKKHEADLAVRIQALEEALTQLPGEVRIIKEKLQTHALKVQEVGDDLAYWEKRIEDLGEAVYLFNERIDKRFLNTEEGQERLKMFQEMLDRRIDQQKRVLMTHEYRLAITETALETAGRTSEPRPYFEIYDSKTFGKRVKELLQKSWNNVTDTSLVPPILDWLTPSQRGLKPAEYDLILSIHLLSKNQYVHASAVEGILGWKKNDIRDVARRFRMRGLIQERKLSREEWNTTGTPPVVYFVADDALKMFVSNLSTNGPLHDAMELKVFLESARLSPPELFLTTQSLGKPRCDSILAKRIDRKEWNWRTLTAINIETPEEVRAHSSIEPDKEGQVFSNMLTPFVSGAKYVEVACLEESVEKLSELKNVLPKWLSDRIKVRVVTV